MNDKGYLGYITRKFDDKQIIDVINYILEF